MTLKLSLYVELGFIFTCQIIYMEIDFKMISEIPWQLPQTIIIVTLRIYKSGAEELVDSHLSGLYKALIALFYHFTGSRPYC